MKLFSTLSTAALALVATASTSFGLVGYDISAGVLPVADGSQINLIADLNKDGIILDDPNDFAPGVDDFVIASVPMNSFLGLSGAASFSISNIDVAGLVGANLYLAFYDIPYAPANTSAGPGVSVGAVGAFAANEFGLNGFVWEVEATNGGFTINYVSQSVAEVFFSSGAGYPADAQFTDQTASTIPQPAAIGMGLVGLVTMLVRRRRK